MKIIRTQGEHMTHGILYGMATGCILLLLAYTPVTVMAALSAVKTVATRAESFQPRSILKEPDWKATWNQLALKLQADGLDTELINNLFSRIDSPPSLVPMGTKITELYTNHFLPKKNKHKVTPFETELGIPGPWFKGVVSSQNAMLCKKFIDDNASAFALAELSSGVPQEVAAALLFVETRLGTYVGKDNAFLMLAGMSVSRNPMDFTAYLDKLSGSYDHIEWIRQKMESKADWAYAELKALLDYCFSNNIDPLQVPGSIYGAIGLCQFMPSNIARRAVDGNKDGRIDLFSPDDAVSSLSNYLQKSGWKDGIDLEKQIKVLRSYNAMTIYARTILALAETIRRLDGQSDS